MPVLEVEARDRLGLYPEGGIMLLKLAEKPDKNQIQRLKSAGLMDGNPRSIMLPGDMEVQIREELYPSRSWMECWAEGYLVCIPLTNVPDHRIRPYINGRVDVNGDEVIVDGKVCGRVRAVFS